MQLIGRPDSCLKHVKLTDSLTYWCGTKQIRNYLFVNFLKYESKRGGLLKIEERRVKSSVDVMFGHLLQLTNLWGTELFSPLVANLPRNL